MSQDILLTPEQVAERLGVSRLTAVRWMRSGKLPNAQKLGRKTVRLPATALEKYLQQQPALTLVDATAPMWESPKAVDLRIEDADILERAKKLRRPGESLSAVVIRVLRQALQAQDTPGPTPMAGATQHPTQYREAMLARLRAMKAQGLSLQKMADQLNAEGVPTVSGHGRWQKGTIGDMLAQG